MYVGSLVDWSLVVFSVTSVFVCHVLLLHSRIFLSSSVNKTTKHKTKPKGFAISCVFNVLPHSEHFRKHGARLVAMAAL